VEVSVRPRDAPLSRLSTNDRVSTKDSVEPELTRGPNVQSAPIWNLIAQAPHREQQNLSTWPRVHRVDAKMVEEGAGNRERDALIRPQLMFGVKMYMEGCNRQQIDWESQN
jgi:hypothetical protein